MTLLPNAKLTGEARGYQWLISMGSLLILLNVLVGDVIAPLFLPASAALFDGYWSAMPAAVGKVGLLLVEDLAAICYLFGLSAAHDLLEEVAQGRLFAGRAAKSLGRVGSWVLLGALSAVIISPTLLAWIGRDGPFDLVIETETLVIAAIGGALAVTARLVARAGALQAELSEII